MTIDRGGYNRIVAADGDRQVTSVAGLSGANSAAGAAALALRPATRLRHRSSPSGLSLWRQLPSKKAPDFHRKGFVQDVAFDMAGGGQQDLAGADAADHLAAHGDVLGKISPWISALSPITRPTLRTSPSTRPSIWMSPVEVRVPLITMSALMMEGADERAGALGGAAAGASGIGGWRGDGVFAFAREHGGLPR